MRVNYPQASEVVCKADEPLTQLIQAQGKASFADGYQWGAEEALGILIAGYFRWDGIAILTTAAEALTDANFHDEATIITDMRDRILATT